MANNKITVAKRGEGKSMLVPLWVIRNGNHLTISCNDPDHSFRCGTTIEQLEKFREKLEEIFQELVEKS